MQIASATCDSGSLCWPVAQVPGDGRWVTTVDRPSHFNLTTFVQWQDHERTARTRTRIMLQGMTDREPAALEAFLGRGRLKKIRDKL